MKKKILIATSSTIVGTLIIVMIVLCAIFAPRNLKNLIPEDGAKSVKLVSPFNKEEEYLLSEEEVKEFWVQVKETKYEPQIDLLKACSVFKVEIEYKNGKKIIFDEYKVVKYDVNGESLKVTPIFLKFYVYDKYKDKFSH